MRKIVVVAICFFIFGCKDENVQPKETPVTAEEEVLDSVPVLDDVIKPIALSLEEANVLAQLPLDCIGKEYPNKLQQTLTGSEELKEPKELHPAFFGCFDWHSSVHGHWSLVVLLKRHPGLERTEEIREKLKNSLSSENIQAEVAYFQKEHNNTFERTYGWAWLLKLAEELHTWEDPLARELESNLQPLTAVIVENFKDFLPKLGYAIRVGEHTNTAFALGFAHDYALQLEDEALLKLIERSARNFYLNDDNCPLDWEPSGFDFLSPCLSEVDIMRRVLPKNAFSMWMEDFLPQLKDTSFELEVGEVTDRTDGKLVHLDGLNFSRAWVFFGLANQYPEYSHLREIAQEHMQYSYPNLLNDSYEGGHWLGTFALYALMVSEKK